MARLYANDAPHYRLKIARLSNGATLAVHRGIIEIAVSQLSRGREPKMENNESVSRNEIAPGMLQLC
jgi:hypothetical protein